MVVGWGVRVGGCGVWGGSGVWGEVGVGVGCGVGWGEKEGAWLSGWLWLKQRVCEYGYGVG